MSPDVKLSFDMKNRKIWGLKKGIIAYEIFSWNFRTGEYISGERIFAGSELKIIGFNREGLPILARSGFPWAKQSTRPKEASPRRKHQSTQTGVVSVPLVPTHWR